MRGLHVCVQVLGDLAFGWGVSSGEMDERLPGCGTAVQSLEFVAARVGYGMITVARTFTVKRSVGLP